LKEYKKPTKHDLASHPLTAELHSRDSPSAIIAVLRTQADPSQNPHGRLIGWLVTTVPVLHAFSATLGNGVEPIFPPSNAIFSGIGVLLQATKDVRSAEDVLVGLFDRIEMIFQPLVAYTGIRPTAAMADIVAKIVVNVLYILGIVTKEVGRDEWRSITRLEGRMSRTHYVG